MSDHRPKYVRDRNPRPTHQSTLAEWDEYLRKVEEELSVASRSVIARMLALECPSDTMGDFKLDRPFPQARHWTDDDEE